MMHMIMQIVVVIEHLQEKISREKITITIFEEDIHDEYKSVEVYSPGLLQEVS